MMDKKEKIKQYKSTARDMGVFVIESQSNGKVLIEASKDIHAMMNRYKVELGFGSCRNTRLQNDWNEYGEGSFVFKVLETLEPLEDPSYDPTEDLQFLKDLWVDKLEPFDERGYNRRPKKPK